jgi:hypothetical protein
LETRDEARGTGVVNEVLADAGVDAQMQPAAALARIARRLPPAGWKKDACLPMPDQVLAGSPFECAQ